MNKIEILTFGKQIIKDELLQINYLHDRLDDNFSDIINILYNCKGKIIVVGVGKNAPIAQKMVATLNSTGTISQFLHAGEALHGDLGLLCPEDVVLVLSKSGNTAEIKQVIPSLKELSKKVVAITGNLSSYLATQADFVLDTTISKEAGPMNLAPTSSTTVQLVLCDAIAMTLKKLKGFTANDFGKYHPGGSLGKQLNLRIMDMIDSTHKPKVNMDSCIKDVIQSLSSGRFGITTVMEGKTIKGVITDGDLRRMLEKYSDFSSLKAKDIATFSPKLINKKILAKDALKMINKFEIGQLIVVNDNQEYMGIIDFHGLTNEGIRAE